MKLILMFIMSISIISCSSDRSNNIARTAICTKSNLNLDSYKASKAITMSLPSNPNKNGDEEVAKDGIYILTQSIVHIHDLSQPVPDKFAPDGPEFLQFSIAYTPAPQSAADKESNTLKFNGSVNCLSGLAPGHAGNLNYASKVPTTIEVKDLGSKFVPKTLNTVEFGYKKDRSMKIVSIPADKGAVDKIEDINSSDAETITNIYRKGPTSETYQLQSRVTQGDTILTVISSYTRCVDPSEEATTPEAKKVQESRTQEQSDKLEEKYELCLNRLIQFKSQP